MKAPVLCDLADLRALLAGVGVREPPPALLDTRALAHELSVSTKHVERLRAQGLPYVRVGVGAVRYDLARVLAWLDSQSAAE